MPRHPSSLTTYDLLHTPGLYAAVSSDDGAVVLVAIRLAGIMTAKDGSTVPLLRRTGPVKYDYQGDANAILFEPYELPTLLRNMLWPREVPAEVVAPVEPPSAPFPTAGNIDDEPVPAGSSDYDGPAF